MRFLTKCLPVAEYKNTTVYVNIYGNTQLYYEYTHDNLEGSHLHYREETLFRNELRQKIENVSYSWKLDNDLEQVAKKINARNYMGRKKLKMPKNTNGYEKLQEKKIFFQ